MSNQLQQCDYLNTKMANLTLVESNLQEKQGETWWAGPSCQGKIQANPMLPSDPLARRFLAKALAEMIRPDFERLRAQRSDNQVDWHVWPGDYRGLSTLPSTWVDLPFSHHPRSGVGDSIPTDTDKTVNLRVANVLQG